MSYACKRNDVCERVCGWVGGGWGNASSSRMSKQTFVSTVCVMCDITCVMSHFPHYVCDVTLSTLRV
jgi:hypothetical protein